MTSFSHPALVVEDETNVEAVHFTLKWSIRGFEGLKNKDDMYSTGITMAELGMEESYRGRWRIGIIPCNTVTENNVKMDYVAAFLCLTDDDLKSTFYTGERALSLQFKTCVTTGKLRDVPISAATSFTDLRTFSKDTCKRGYSCVMSHQNLFGSDEKAGSLKDSCFNIAIDVVLYKEPEISRISAAVFPSLLQRYQEFLGRALKRQDEGADFLLISNDNQEFHVDRSFLMTHSPVFAAMLNHDSKEKQTSRCEMNDFDGECVAILLEYVYGCETGKIKGSNAEKVLVMADKYQMMDLRTVCELTLANDITVDNAVQIFVLASQRNLGTLKDVAVKFIRKNIDIETILQESMEL